MDLKGSDALKTERVIEDLTARYPWVDIARIHTPADVKFAAERIDFWNFDLPGPSEGEPATLYPSKTRLL